jgi:hypothetical protein
MLYIVGQSGCSWFRIFLRSDEGGLGGAIFPIVFHTELDFLVNVGMALSTRKFGTTCPICKRFCFLSYIEIEETASVGELRAKLLRQGWLGEQARCDDPKCIGQTFCAWNQAVFPR